MFPIQEMNYLINLFFIFLRCCISLTRSKAAFHMIIQACPSLSLFLWKISRTSANTENVMDQIQRIFCSSYVWIRSKITCLIFFHLSSHHHSWIHFINCNPNIGISFSIFEHRIVAWTMFFN